MRNETDGNEWQKYQRNRPQLSAVLPPEHLAVDVAKLCLCHHAQYGRMPKAAPQPPENQAVGFEAFPKACSKLSISYFPLSA
jgi:hypothetical protein